MLKRLNFLLLIVYLLPCLSFGATARLVNIEGGIGPASADYMVRSLEKAQRAGDELFIIQLDTPGGLDKSMRVMVKAILASRIPVVTFVAPSGSRAASAGTFLLYASHVAAMAPGTNLGAASPVSLTGGMGGNTKKNSQASTMKAKVTNDAVAYIKSLAQLRQRDPTFAVKAVTESKSISAAEALKNNVIEIIAVDVDDLLKKLQGKKIKINQQEKTLSTKTLTVNKTQPDWRTKLLSVITDPSVAYILLLLGAYGLFFEFTNPGMVIPGVIGAIAILLALYALNLLPISYAGLGLIALGIIFMISEAFVPSFGALGFGGIIAFIIGSVLLLDTELPAYQIAWPIIVTMAVTNLLIFSVVCSMALRSHRRKLDSGIGLLVGKTGILISDLRGGFGKAKVQGEIWNVYSDAALTKNTRVSVDAVKGLVLTVSAMEK